MLYDPGTEKMTKAMVFSNRRHAFTMIELMVVISIIGIIITIAFTVWMRAREVSRARSCQENLTKIEHAKEQYAVESGIAPGSMPTWAALVGQTLYIKRSPACPGGGVYTLNSIDNIPTCSYVLPPWLSDGKYEHSVR